MTRDITPAGSPATGSVDEAFRRSAGELRSVLSCGRDRGARHSTTRRMSRRPAGRATVSRRGAGRAPLGPNAGTDRLPRRQDRGRAPAGPGPGRPRGPDHRAGNGGGGGLARSLGDEPDADQCIDAPVRPRCPAARGSWCRHRRTWVSKSAASRRFVALSAARLADFMAADGLGVRPSGGPNRRTAFGHDLVLVAAIGVDGEGNKHPLALLQGSTENAATVQALL